MIFDQGEKGSDEDDCCFWVEIVYCQVHVVQCTVYCRWTMKKSGLFGKSHKESKRRKNTEAEVRNLYNIQYC
jgi:hypothetical protein